MIIKSKLRDTDSSIAFQKGGAYFLKNNNFDVMVSCFPLGQSGRGGHNHIDIGSFTLSYNGIPIIVDPGTYTYTRSLKARNKFKSIFSHNCLITQNDKNINLDKNGIFGVNKYYEYKILINEYNKLKFSIKRINDHKKRFRTFVLKDNFISIVDKYDGIFHTIFHLHPYINVIRQQDHILIGNRLILQYEGKTKIIKYIYSKRYEKKELANKIGIKSNNINTVKFVIKN